MIIARILPSNIWRNIFAALMVACAGMAHADVTPLEVDRSDAALAYQRALWLSGVRSEAIYVDQVDGEIPMNGVSAFKPREERENRDVELPIDTRIMALLVLVGIGVLLWKFGGGTQVVWRTGGGDGNVDGAGAIAAAAEYETMETRDFLTMVANLPDRREAMVLLVGRALLRAANSNGIRLRRSDTARGILRRVPKTWRHLDALDSIVRLGEITYFGGRDMSDAQFAACIDKARPIMSGAQT